MNELAMSDKEVSNALAQAQNWVIRNDDDFAMVDAHCVGLMALKKKIESDFASSKATTYAAWKAVVAQEKGHLDGIDEARKLDKQKMDGWLHVKEAERKALEDKMALEAKANAEAAALAAAVAAEQSGDSELAEAIISEPVAAQVVVVANTAPKAQTVLRKIWKFRVVNASLVPSEYKAVDEKKVGAVVRALGADCNIAGIETWQENI